MNDQTYYRSIKFIDDHPASSDEFRGQPHNSIADTLVSILSSGDDGCAIGLEGTWGSGKSTVVDIARLKLQNLDGDDENSIKHTFFVFDVWAHQSDPLRRVFLQELIQYLESRHAVSEAYWHEQLEKLETHSKKIIEKKTEKLSWVAKSVLFTLPLLPLAYGLISRSTQDFSINFPFVGMLCLTYWHFGIFIIAIPFLFAAGTWISWRNGWKNSEMSKLQILSPSWWRTTEEKQGKSVIWAFTRQTDHVTTDQLISENEATTVEFNEIFEKLIKNAAKKKHRVVIVFDNLDRLPSELIRSSWATMRSFFAVTPGTPHQEALKNVWLIVPFDRAHIEAVFDKDKNDEVEDATPGFIEKTFEIILRVPPPILSNWREFLSKKLQGSFGDKISLTECYEIFRIFDHYNKLHRKTITPRTINAFVNTIAAQAKQWGNLIPLQHQALYALYKHTMAQSIAKLQDSSLIEESVRAQIVNPDWAKSLAAAHYNVPLDEAIEVLLTPEIEKAFLEHDADRLSTLKQTSGFPLILASYVSENVSDWVAKTPAAFLDAATTLGKLSLDDDAVESDVWRKMQTQIKNINVPIPITESAASGLHALISHSHDNSKREIAQQLVQALSISQADLAKEPENLGKVWVSLFEEIADALPTNILETSRGEIFSEIPIQTNVEYLLGVASAASESNKIPFSAFVPSDSSTDIGAAIVRLVNLENLPSKLKPILRAFLLVPDCVAWALVVSAMQNRIQNPSPPLASTDAFCLLSHLEAMSRLGLLKDPVPDAIKAINDDGSLHAILGKALTDTQSSLVALAIFLLMSHRKGNLAGPGDHPQHGSLAQANTFLSTFQASPEDSMLVDSLAKLAVRADEFSAILQAALSQDDNYEVYRAVLRRMVALGTYQRLRRNIVLTRTTRIANILGPDLTQKFLKRFDNWTISEEIAEDKWTAIDSQFLILSYPLNTKNYEIVVNGISNNLSAFTKDQWLTPLANEDDALRLLFALIEVERPPQLEEDFYDALTEHADSFIQGASSPTKFREKWPHLMGLLVSARKRQFADMLRQKLLAKAVPAEKIRECFMLFGADFPANANFQKNADEVVKNFLDPILAEGTTESIEFMRDWAPAFATAIASADDENKQLIQDRLEHMFEAGDEEVKATITGLASNMGLEIDTQQASVEPDEDASEPSS